MVATHSLREDLRARGFTQVKPWTRGVDPRLFRPEGGGIARRAGTPVFLHVGRLAVEKNVEAFLALDLPGEKWVVGDGPEAARLRSAYPGVRWFGTLHGAALADAYRSADVTVFPSRTDTFGLVLLESMACGTPVAALPVTGPLDVVGDSAGGALDADLRAACLRALALPREGALARAATFTWERATREFLAALSPIAAALPAEAVPA